MENRYDSGIPIFGINVSVPVVESREFISIIDHETRAKRFYSEYYFIIHSVLLVDLIRLQNSLKLPDYGLRTRGSAMRSILTSIK